MKIIKTTNNEIALILSEEEVIDLLTKSGLKVETNQVRPEGGEDKFKGLSIPTRDFFEAIKKRFGNSIVNFKDLDLRKIQTQLRIKQMGPLLANFEKRGLMTVVRTETNFIDSFQII